MAGARPQQEANRPARLVVPEEQGAASIRQQIAEGAKLKERQIANEGELRAARDDYYSWDEYNDTLLRRILDNDQEQ